MEEETPHIMFLNLVYFSQQINRQNQRISAQGDTQLQLMGIRSKARGGSRKKETNKEEKKEVKEDDNEKTSRLKFKLLKLFVIKSCFV